MLSKPNWLSCLAVLALTCGNSSCSSQEKELLKQTPDTKATLPETATSSWSSMSVTSTTQLPTCDQTKSGALAWVKDEKKFYTCEASNWQVADIPTTRSHSVWGKSQLPACDRTNVGSIAWVQDEKKLYTCEYLGWKHAQEKEEGGKSYSVSYSGLLPQCDATRQGDIGWVRDEQQFYTCETLGWERAETSGAKSYSVSTYDSLPACNLKNLDSHAWVSERNSFYTCESAGWLIANQKKYTYSEDYLFLLPTCNSSLLDALAYVRREENFYTCESTGWTIATVAQDEPFEIAGRWTYHTDTYANSPSISEEASSWYPGYIGDVEVVKFTNGMALFTVSGTFTTWTTDDVSAVAESFSFSGIIPTATGETIRIFKFSSFSNTRLRIKINFSYTTPQFKAVVDTDGNFTDNVDKSFTLTSAPY